MCCQVELSGCVAKAEEMVGEGAGCEGVEL